MSFYSRFASVYEQVFPLRGPVVERVTRILGGQSRRVLDIGCGTAHLVSELRTQGHRCTGIDLDEAMIAQAQKRDPELDLHVLGMQDLNELGDTYSAALCLGNVLPHLESDGLAAFLETLHGILEPDSPWLVQTVNFDALAGRDAWNFADLDVGDGYVFQRSYGGLKGTNCRFRTRLRKDDELLFNTLYCYCFDDMVFPITSTDSSKLIFSAPARPTRSGRS